ncbi:MAG TPA: OmpA family protein [Bacteroidales bacterium]|jgi:OOP family OmpA-OmpF porin|nr:OmpA family protein [Bacteroidales bacterium]
MRIIITGIVALAIWCVFSAWVYNDKLLPMMKAPEPVPETPSKPTAADSLASIRAMMPAKLSVYFEFNDAKFKNDQQTDSKIAEFKGWLDKYPGSTLSVTGHTDLVGTEAYNNELAMKRAVVVGEYIKKAGIAPDKMIVESRGENEPAGDNITAEGRAKNRRTEISLKMN